MRKIICMVISLIVLLGSSSALAEGFSIHSGVEFGMTMEEVIQKEKDAGFTDVEIIELTKSDQFNCSSFHQKNAVSVNGQIAGVKGANITYHFDENEKMDSAVYLLAFGDSFGTYSPIRESLINKYGEADTEKPEIWHSYLNMDGYSYADYCLTEYNVPIAGITCDITYNYNDSWLIPQDDKYIIISGCEYKLSVSGYGKAFYCTYVTYQQFDKDDIDNVLAQVGAAVDTYNSQLINDL